MQKFYSTGNILTLLPAFTRYRAEVAVSIFCTVKTQSSIFTLLNGDASKAVLIASSIVLKPEP